MSHTRNDFTNLPRLLAGIFCAVAALTTMPALAQNLNGNFVTPASASVVPRLNIHLDPFTASDARAITLRFPTSVQSDSIRIKLNGKDVTSDFEESECSDAFCEAGTVSSVDGLLAGKNVLTATGKLADGSLVGNRLRFVGDEPAARERIRESRQRSPSKGTLKDSSSGTLPTASSFMPPTISFKTIGAGGAAAGQAWLQLGTQTQFSIGSDCSSRYSVIVLDRQTLAQKTSAPESSPKCLNSGSDLTQYLTTLTSNDLVIAGSNVGKNTDADAQTLYFDTSSIGGKVYNAQDPKLFTPANDKYSHDIPRGYVVIGVPGSAPGSAFENYYLDSDVDGMFPSFNGMLAEDSSGNYNYRPANAVEYYTTPNDPTFSPAASTFTLINGDTKTIYLTPYNNGVGGYWLLRLGREDLVSMPFPSCTGTVWGKTNLIPNCGVFYPTGQTDPQSAVQAFVNLANALKSVTRDELVVLETVGNPISASNNVDAAHLSYGGTTAYAGNFAPAIETLGAPAASTLNVGANAAWSLVSCLECGDALTGHAAWSSTAYAQQGQTGMMHGLLEPNRNGLYWSTHSAQMTPGGPDTADYTLDILNATQPTEWPELRALLPGASSLQGQIAAYRYASYQLITTYYIKEATGSYLDDIHYFFTGSNNTMINYHYFDPISLTYPGSSCYSWMDPVTNNTQTCFTQQDFQAVITQLSTEIIDITNLNTFLFSGSQNMQGIVATNTGSAAMALISAASQVKASTLAPPDSTPVALNLSNILGLAGNVINISATVASGGLIPDDLAKLVGPSLSVIGSMTGGAGNVMGGFTTPGVTPVPNPDAKFLTTIGQLSDNSLQSAMTSGFESEADAILGDWNKISQIGPRIVDTDDPTFYHPNQDSQALAVKELGLASQRSFFLALLPTEFNVHFYPGWEYLTPSMGTSTGPVLKDGCNPWYGSDFKDALHNTAPTRAAAGIPGWAGNWDVSVMGGAVQNAGKNNQTFQVVDPSLANTLTSSQATSLNIPLDELFFRYGPMKNSFLDFSVSNFTNFPSTKWCADVQ